MFVARRSKENTPRSTARTSFPTVASESPAAIPKALRVWIRAEDATAAEVSPTLDALIDASRTFNPSDAVNPACTMSLSPRATSIAET